MARRKKHQKTWVEDDGYDDWGFGAWAQDFFSDGGGSNDGLRLKGTPGNDEQIGSDGDDVIKGLAGDDLLEGLAGNDRLIGGVGSDTIEGGDGNDILIGDDAGSGSGSYGSGWGSGSGSGSRSGSGSGDDRDGTASDYLSGGADNDVLYGGRGDDTLQGGSGNDLVLGGAGDDLVVFNLSDNQGFTDIAEGGRGTDTMRVELTAAQAALPEVQQALAALEAFITANANPRAKGGEIEFDDGEIEFEPSEAPGFVFSVLDATLVLNTFEFLDVAVLGPQITIVGNTAVGTLDIGPGVLPQGDTILAGVIDGDSFTSDGGIIGNQAGSDGTTTVDGNGRWNVGADGLLVGKEGNGALRVTNGGQVNTNNGVAGPGNPGSFLDLVVGATPTGIGSVVVTGTGSRVSTSGNDNRLLVGSNGGEGDLTVENGGLVETFFLEVGRGAGSIGDVEINGSGSAIIVSSETGFFSNNPEGAGFARVGSDNGDASLRILNGGRLEVREGTTQNTTALEPGLLIGSDGSDASVLVDGAGSLLSVAQNAPSTGGESPFFSVGRGGDNGGTGTLIVSNGGVVEMLGDGSFLQVGRGGDPGTGDLGVGLLDVRSGGSVQIDGGSTEAGLNLGSNDTFAVGTLNIDGASSVVEITGPVASFNVGRAGDGTLSITNGGQLLATSSTSSFHKIARDAGSTGTATIDGAGSRIELTAGTSGIGKGGLGVGDRGDGELYILNGGELVANYASSFHNVADREGSNGYFLIDGPGSQAVLTSLEGNFDIGDQGTGLMEIRNGGRFSFKTLGVDAGEFDGRGSVTLGDADLPGSDGTLIVTGSGSVASLDFVDGGLAVGGSSTGELVISDGGRLELSASGTVFPNVGSNAGASGTITIDGANSELSIDIASGNLNVGLFGNGNLVVRNGASFDLTAAGNSDNHIAFGAGSTGTIVVDDAIATIDGALFVGKEGTADLLVTNGGSFASTAFATDFSNLIIGDLAPGVGTITVSGAGSSYEFFNPTGRTDVRAHIGFEGDGTFNVLDGGQATLETEVTVAHQSGSTGTLRVDGAGSVFEAVNNTITLGFNGESLLDVSNQGVVRANAVVMEADSTINGDDGIIDGDLFVNSGVVDIGDPVGSLAITGRLIQNEGTLDIDAEGLSAGVAGGYDLLEVGGFASLSTGLVHFTFGGGFAPTAGNVFQFIEASGSNSVNPGSVSLAVTGLADGFQAFLSSNVSGVRLTAATGGTAEADTTLLFGTFRNDVFDGGAGNDVLDGGGSDDTLTGGADNDTLTGGADNDTFVFAQNDGNDTITDFDQAGDDRILFNTNTGLANDGDVFAAATDDGTDTTIAYTGGTVTLSNVLVTDLTNADFDFFT